MTQALLSDLARPISNIVHIGAGTGAELPAYLAIDAQTVLLVEANPGTAAELKTRAAEHPGVTVITAAVSADPERRPFRHTNFPELDSFRQPAELKGLFPGLRILSQDPVLPENPVRVIGELDLKRKGSNLLTLETPGESLGILQALQAADILLHFDAIRLREGQTQLYEEAATAPEIRDYLFDLGFATMFEETPEDPDRPYLNARLDRARVALKRERDTLGESLKEAEAKRLEVTDQNATLHQEKQTLRQQLDDARKQAETSSSQLETLTAERDTARKEKQTLRQQLDDARKQAETSSSQLETLTAERDTARKEKQTLRQQLDDARKQITMLSLARDEILKAEGQIELIRDLLLQGEGL